MSKKEKIEDFGNKIGGARKDLWQTRNLVLDDLKDMTAVEREKYITKKQVWKAPDYMKMYESGLSKRVVFYIKTIHDKLPAKPISNDEYYQDGYVQFVGEIRDKAMEIKTEDDAKAFWRETICDYCNDRFRVYENRTFGCLENKLFKAAQIVDNFYSIDRKIEETQFLYSDEEKAMSGYEICKYDKENVIIGEDGYLVRKKGNNLKRYTYIDNDYFKDIGNWQENTYFILTKKNPKICDINFYDYETAKNYVIENLSGQNTEQTKHKSHKKKFVPPQLENVIRTGDSRRQDEKHITGDDMLSEFGFSGGEFGNWLSENDRQHNLDYSYDAFKDLAVALNISDKDISLGGKLSIAYGARGHSSALAHFEPERNVINLTKMKGAGSLAHEWGHALDFFLANNADIHLATKVTYMSDSGWEEIRGLMDSMKLRPLTEEEKIQKWQATRSHLVNNFTRYVCRSYGFDNRVEEEQQLIQKAIDKCIETGATKEEEIDYYRNDVKPQFFKYLEEVDKQTSHSSADNFCSQCLAYIRAIDMLKTPDNIISTEKSEFYKNSEKMDEQYSKDSKGYWASDREMFARAFACYVFDKIEPHQSDYLCGHANTAIALDEDGNAICAFPQGKERKEINSQFDRLFDTLRERGIFKENENSRKREDTQAMENQQEITADKTTDDKDSPHVLAVGDRFKRKLTGEIYEVVSLKGVIPWQDDCTISTESNGIQITSSISYDELLSGKNYEYIGKERMKKLNRSLMKRLLLTSLQKKKAFPSRLMMYLQEKQIVMMI